MRGRRQETENGYLVLIRYYVKDFTRHVNNLHNLFSFQMIGHPLMFFCCLKGFILIQSFVHRGIPTIFAVDLEDQFNFFGGEFPGVVLGPGMTGNR